MLTYTYTSMRWQVIEALGADVDSFNVHAIVDDLQERYGTVDVNTIPEEKFWDVVKAHDIS